MVPGLQIGGLFLAITAVMAFTTWAEAWLDSTASPVTKRVSKARRSAVHDLADGGAEDDMRKVA